MAAATCPGRKRRTDLSRSSKPVGGGNGNLYAGRLASHDNWIIKAQIVLRCSPLSLLWKNLRNRFLLLIGYQVTVSLNHRLSLVTDPTINDSLINTRSGTVRAK